jgi:hypothetical protein
MADEKIEMNWMDDTVASERVDAFAEEEAARSLTIDAHMSSVKDYGWMGVVVTVDDAGDFDAAVSMMKAALDARPAEFQPQDETVSMPPMDMMD